jgi:serine/threonine protein phosphatase 1
MYRHLIVGDVHGNWLALQTALQNIQYEPSGCELVFLGDLIDRGRDSKKVLQYIADLRDQGHEVTTLIGNHEDVLIMGLDGYISALINWIDGGFGGRSTLRSYGIAEDRVSTAGDRFLFDRYEVKTKEDARRFLAGVFGDHLSIIEKSEYSYYIKQFFEGIDAFACHGGLTTDIRIDKTPPVNLVWGDEDWMRSTKPHKERIIAIYGHWHFDRPRIEAKRIGLGMEGEVAILSIEDHVIVTSDGELIEVTREQLKI